MKATLQLSRDQINLRKAAGQKGIQLIFFKPSKPITQTEFVNQRDGGTRVYVNADSDVVALAVSREVQGATAETVQTGDGVRQTGEASVEGIVNEGEEGYNEEAGDLIDGIEIIDGKVGGKIPVNDFKSIRQSSIKNPDADSMTLGRYTPMIKNGVKDWSRPGADSYIARAGKNSSYFDLGSEYNRIQNQYYLSSKEMFDYINRPAIDDAMKSRKTLRFSHNPLDYDTGALLEEWNYIKRKLRLTDENLILKGDFWYVE